MMDKYYPITKFWGFHICLVTIRHPDDLEVILNNTKHIEKSIIYNIFIPWLNTGLLTSRDAKWHSRRKILTSAFHFNVLRKYVDVLIVERQLMTKTLKDVGGTIEKNVFTFASEHTLNAIYGKL
ncbi:PREDICTED: cytochrome P450 4C1-like [Dinoponera quadriceps]|uniref:Cytochrome P450 4C1-like n=1 Tax=Dinoponera quadriceps TaxID=609295 RepID=A0A6P3YAY7_DINQU|nr:PREDICTED: cytochrome P450 4C1-like [Dinoponera quadriceps]